MKDSSECLQVLPVLVCRKEDVKEEFLERRVEQLRNSLTFKPQILKAVIVNDERDVLSLKKHVGKADVTLLFKPHLGQGSCVVKIAEYGLPIILFNEEGKVNNPLDALEYLYHRKEVWVAVDYSAVDSCLRLLSVKKEMERTKILVLNADYPHWERFLCRVSGGIEAIKETFGIDIEYVKSEEVIERWKSIAEKRAVSIAEKWMKEAEKVVEPEKKDLLSVARLYLAMKDLLEEKGAQAITMAYGDDPLPVPCFAYTNLRDEGIPAACEADIISLLSMIILHYVTDKPCFMGNTFVDLKDEAIILSHCVCPRKMKGYSACAVPYVLRSYHTKRFAGSLTAFVKMNTDHEVTICRLGGDLKTMLITKGKIMSCGDINHYCRVTVKIKTDDPRGFIHKTSGNHHVMVYGDFREELKKLNGLFGITTVEI
jgi:L-fucose isomerase-like protein